MLIRAAKFSNFANKSPLEKVHSVASGPVYDHHEVWCAAPFHRRLILSCFIDKFDKLRHLLHDSLILKSISKTLTIGSLLAS